MDKGAAVTAFYQSVASNMAGLPVYNNDLEVEASDFLTVGDSMLGIIVTPWCMNMLLMPSQTSHENSRCTGTTFRHNLPSGQYEFIRAYHETLGDYATCSVFSPMFEFSCQEIAMQTAREVLSALFDEDNQAPTERQLAHSHYQAQREAVLQQSEEITTDNHSEAGDTLDSQRAEVSRRAFLTGSFRSNEDRRV